MSLMEELTSTENKVAFARQAYNDSVMSYNTMRETFPTNMIAGPFGFALALPEAISCAKFAIDPASSRTAGSSHRRRLRRRNRIEIRS